MPTETTPKHLTAPAGESADKKTAKEFDRFHPEMPTIPGVGNAPVRAPMHSSPSFNSAGTQRLARIGGIIAAVVLVVVGILWWITHMLRTPDSSSSESAAADPSVPNLPAFPAATLTREGTTVVATADELSKPWSSKKFTFVKPLTQESVNAIAIRLPGGALWAFALREPNGRCDLEFVTDAARIEQKYGYRATHPMVVSPCSDTVYDPLKVGSLGGDIWTRGEIMQGLGLRPPISIDVQLRGHSIIADSIE